MTGKLFLASWSVAGEQEDVEVPHLLVRDEGVFPENEIKSVKMKLNVDGAVLAATFFPAFGGRRFAAATADRARDTRLRHSGD